MDTIIIVTVGVFISLNAYASLITLNGNHSVTVNVNNQTKKLIFDTIINGYSVNCSGDKLIVWGKPTVINESNPQDTNLILVDLLQGYKKIEKGVSKGVFSVDFIKDKNDAYIGTSQGLFFNLASGKLTSVGPEFDATDSSHFETCNKNSSWEFNKYP